jgi:hypothetical protein
MPAIGFYRDIDIGRVIITAMPNPNCCKIRQLGSEDSNQRIVTLVALVGDQIKHVGVGKGYRIGKTV